MSTVVTGTILQRTDTTESWEYVNPILPNRQLGFERSIYGDPIGMKMGDGVTHWNDLPYWFQTASPIAPIVHNVTAGDVQPATIAHTYMTWPIVIFRNSDGSIYAGATSTDDGTNIIVTGDADGSGNFVDSFKVIVKP